MEGLPTMMKSERRWRSKPLQTSKPSILMAFFSCVAWLYVAGRLWQDAENRTVLSNLLNKNLGQRPKVLSVEDKLAVLGCKDLERRIVKAEMDLTLAKSQGYLKNHLQQKDKATRKILYTGTSDDGELFSIPVNVFAKSFAAKLEHCAGFIGKKIQVLRWHKRLGHLSEEVLAAMLKKFNNSVKVDSCESICSSCMSGKIRRQSFPVRQNTVTCLFEKVHTDVWGPSPKVSV